MITKLVLMSEKCNNKYFIYTQSTKDRATSNYRTRCIHSYVRQTHVLCLNTHTHRQTKKKHWHYSWHPVGSVESWFTNLHFLRNGDKFTLSWILPFIQFIYKIHKDYAREGKRNIYVMSTVSEYVYWEWTYNVVQ